MGLSLKQLSEISEEELETNARSAEQNTTNLSAELQQKLTEIEVRLGQDRVGMLRLVEDRSLASEDVLLWRRLNSIKNCSV